MTDKMSRKICKLCAKASVPISRMYCEDCRTIQRAAACKAQMEQRRLTAIAMGEAKEIDPMYLTRGVIQYTGYAEGLR